MEQDELERILMGKAKRVAPKVPSSKRLAREAEMAARRQLVEDARNAPCADCGVKLPPGCMDMDHVRGTKLFGLSGSSWRIYTILEIKEELAKCEVRCPNCHRLRHHRLKADERQMYADLGMREYSVPGNQAPARWGGVTVAAPAPAPRPRQAGATPGTTGELPEPTPEKGEG